MSQTASGLANSFTILPDSSPLAVSLISTSALACLVSSSMVFQVPPAPAASAILVQAPIASAAAHFAALFMSFLLVLVWPGPLLPDGKEQEPGRVRIDSSHCRPARKLTVAVTSVNENKTIV
ncbi:hypothetical protein ACFSQE_04240 [Vogesella fluminis]|uniref:hypothetical protein n=1 Tax=Vogesella fluminis TaxID=1069161 RepID=UPI0036260A2F